MRSVVSILCLAVALNDAASACTARLFFDLSGNGGDEHAAHPGTLAFGNPTLRDGGGRLYLYFEFSRPAGSGQFRLGVNYNVAIDGGLIEETFNYQPYIEGAQRHRWQEVRGNPAPNPAVRPASKSARYTAVNINAFGLKNDAAAVALDQGYDEVSNTTILGYVDVAGEQGATVWITVDLLGIAGPNCPSNPIYMGFGDEPVPAGGASGRRTTIPEATIVPEPAAWLLLAGGFALIKRGRRL